jgi:hypothetical protein
MTLAHGAPPGARSNCPVLWDMTDGYQDAHRMGGTNA